jgi:hypothetical protein
MLSRRVALLALLPLVPLATSRAAGDAAGQARASLAVINETGYTAGLRVPGSETANLTLIEPSFSYRQGTLWRFSTSLAGILYSADETNARLRVRETYFGMTQGGFDLIVGKHIVRWGTGYAFTATGVLDPPRDPADPTDRLNLNQGREMAQVDYVAGRHDLTVAWASAGLVDTHRPGMRETLAFRYNTLIAGFDTSLIVAHDRGAATLAGGNFTRVFGEAVEVHGEFAWRERAAVLAGGKYTLRSGLGFIGEFYSSATPVTRRNEAFFRISKSRLRELPGWKEWDVTASVVANLNDGSRMGVVDVERRVRHRFSVYARVQAPQGKRVRSQFGSIPYDALLSLGFRMQL